MASTDDISRSPLSRSEMLATLNLKADASNLNIFNKFAKFFKRLDEESRLNPSNVIEDYVLKLYMLYCSLIEYTDEIESLERQDLHMQKLKPLIFSSFSQPRMLNEESDQDLLLKELMFFLLTFNSAFMAIDTVKRYMSEQFHKELARKYWPYEQLSPPLSRQEMLAKINLEPDSSILEIFNKFVKLFKSLDKASRLKPDHADNYVIRLCLLYTSLIVMERSDIHSFLSLEQNTEVIQRVKLHIRGAYPMIHRYLGEDCEDRSLADFTCWLLTTHPCIVTYNKGVLMYMSESLRDNFRWLVNKRIQFESGLLSFLPESGHIESKREASLTLVYGDQLFTFGGVPPPLSREEMLRLFDLPPTASARDIFSRFLVTMETMIKHFDTQFYLETSGKQFTQNQFLRYCNAYASLISYDDGFVKVGEAANTTLLEVKRILHKFASLQLYDCLRSLNMKDIVALSYVNLSVTSESVLQHMSAELRGEVMRLKNFNRVLRQREYEGEQRMKHKNTRVRKRDDIDGNLITDIATETESLIASQNKMIGESQGFQTTDSAPKINGKDNHSTKSKKGKGKKRVKYKAKKIETTQRNEPPPREKKKQMPLLNAAEKEDNQAWMEKHRERKKREQEKEEKERKRLEKLRQELSTESTFVPSIATCRPKENEANKHKKRENKREKRKKKVKQESTERSSVNSRISDTSRPQLAPDSRIGTRLSDLKFNIFNPPKKEDKQKRPQFEGHAESDTKELKMAPYVLRRKGCDEVEAFSNFHIPPLAPPPEKNVWEERMKTAREKRPISKEEMEDMTKLAMEMTAMNMAARESRENEFHGEYAFPDPPRSTKAVRNHGDDFDDAIFQSDDEDIEKSVADASNSKKKLNSTEKNTNTTSMSFADQLYDEESESDYDTESETESSESEHEEPEVPVSTQWHRSDLSDNTFLSLIQGLGLAQNSQKQNEENVQNTRRPTSRPTLLENDTDETLSLFQ